MIDLEVPARAICPRWYSDSKGNAWREIICPCGYHNHLRNEEYQNMSRFYCHKCGAEIDAQTLEVWKEVPHD